MNEFIKKELKMGCLLAPVNIPIGIVVSYLVLVLSTGNFNDAFLILVFSIVCTAGLSLILFYRIFGGFRRE